eukprot:TRINITY_DN2846_c0_g1_i1.p1 TRINITY_DN2846_c0_g1~~TRINITY_DN2846_c0_g1_i1.p1  ORF type:complete len:640 (+),score=91.34 TRINITY_DN2846_c0_g1_i1:191-1921(+)
MDDALFNEFVSEFERSEPRTVFVYDEAKELVGMLLGVFDQTAKYNPEDSMRDLFYQLRYSCRLQRGDGTTDAFVLLNAYLSEAHRKMLAHEFTDSASTTESKEVDNLRVITVADMIAHLQAYFPGVDSHKDIEALKHCLSKFVGRPRLFFFAYFHEFWTRCTRSVPTTLDDVVRELQDAVPSAVSVCGDMMANVLRRLELRASQHPEFTALFRDTCIAVTLAAGRFEVACDEESELARHSLLLAAKRAHTPSLAGAAEGDDAVDFGTAQVHHVMLRRTPRAAKLNIQFAAIKNPTRPFDFNDEPMAMFGYRQHLATLLKRPASDDPFLTSLYEMISGHVKWVSPQVKGCQADLIVCYVMMRLAETRSDAYAFLRAMGAVPATLTTSLHQYLIQPVKCFGALHDFPGSAEEAFADDCGVIPEHKAGPDAIMPATYEVAAPVPACISVQVHVGRTKTLAQALVTVNPGLLGCKNRKKWCAKGGEKLPEASVRARYQASASRLNHAVRVVVNPQGFDDNCVVAVQKHNASNPEHPIVLVVPSSLAFGSHYTALSVPKPQRMVSGGVERYAKFINFLQFQ